MGLWTFVSSLWDSDALIQGTILAQRNAFSRAKRRWPDRDPHAWLASALSTRPGWGGRPEGTYYHSTVIFSMVGEDTAPKAMAMWILSKENSPIADRCAAEFERLVAPILQLAGTTELEQKWRRMNPWSAARFPDIGYGLGRAGTPEGRAEYEEEVGRNAD